MLRWKLFLPLAVALTVAVILGSHYWTVFAADRQLSSINSNDTFDIDVRDNTVIVNLSSGQALSDSLTILEGEQGAKLLQQKRLIFNVQDRETVNDFISNQVELILAQTIATKEYYHGSELLVEFATKWGYSAEMFIWEDRIIVQVQNENKSFITQRALTEEVSR